MSTNISDVGTIVDTTLDGRSVERVVTVAVVEAGSITLDITAQHLRTIDAVYQVQVDKSSPPASVGVISHKVITNNILGITIDSVSVATTLECTSVLLGF